jgi:hypothetical protein
MSLTLETAQAVVDKAVEYGAWSWDNPEDAKEPAQVQEKAGVLLDAAAQAGSTGSVNPAVMEILHAAGVSPTSDTSRQAYLERFGVAPSNGSSPSSGSAFGAPETSPPAPHAAAGEPVATEPAAPAGGDVDISEIFPGYDDMKVKDIKAAVLASALSGDLSPQEWEQIKIYEAANEERKTILSLQPEFRASEPEPAQPDHGAGAFGPPGDSRDTGHTASPGEDDVPLEQAYSGQAPSLAQQEGLPIPHDADFSGAPNLPIDITNITDDQLSTLGTKFHSYFARGQWLLSQEEGRATMAEHLAREAEHDAYAHAYSLHREQIPEEKRTQPTALEAARKLAEKDAEVAEPVRTWRSRRVKHSVNVRELKALCLGWDKAVWRVDKELDRRMRQQTTGRAA